jgi:hypothetical protein
VKALSWISALIGGASYAHKMRIRDGKFDPALRAMRPDDGAHDIRATARGSAVKASARNATAIIATVEGTPLAAEGVASMSVSKRGIGATY